MSPNRRCTGDFHSCAARPFQPTLQPLCGRGITCMDMLVVCCAAAGIAFVAALQAAIHHEPYKCRRRCTCLTPTSLTRAQLFFTSSRQEVQSQSGFDHLNASRASCPERNQPFNQCSVRFQKLFFTCGTAATKAPPIFSRHATTNERDRLARWRQWSDGTISAESLRFCSHIASYGLALVAGWWCRHFVQAGVKLQLPSTTQCGARHGFTSVALAGRWQRWGDGRRRYWKTIVVTRGSFPVMVRQFCGRQA